MADVDLNELERYLKIYQENPDSRVFAPLADLYRRLGRLREAEEISREGIRRHPYYAGGRVALAHVLLDKEELDGALEEAEAVVTYYPDNLLARKILIRALGKLGEKDKALRELDALKFMAPSVADDPELLRAARGEALAESLPQKPGARLLVPKREEKTIPVISLQSLEKTEEGVRSLDPSPLTDREKFLMMKKKAQLMKQKLVLEKLIEGFKST